LVASSIIITAFVAHVVSGQAVAEKFSYKKVCADFKHLFEEANIEGPSWVESTPGLMAVASYLLLNWLS
jgi:hypothetical protein